MYRTEGAGEARTGALRREAEFQSEVASLQLAPLSAFAKRALDILLAGGLLLMFLPLVVFIVVGVWRSSPGPILYNQPRAGRHGKPFRFYKFRSMMIDSDEFLTSFLESNPSAKSRWDEFQKLEDDPRITPFGRFIRRSSLDELPQLWNVLKGDMSLVGPRPCMVDQRALYGAHWAAYCAVRPGLTGLWQVSGRNRLTYQQRVALDADYVTRWSAWLDIKILLRTVKVVLTGYGSQ